MPLNKTIKRELQVAFSKRVQPVWARVLKYILLALFIYLIWHSRWFWEILISIFALAFLLHFWYRYKTKRWTKSYGGWDYDKHKPD